MKLNVSFHDDNTIRVEVGNCGFTITNLVAMDLAKRLRLHLSGHGQDVDAGENGSVTVYGPADRNTCIDIAGCWFRITDEQAQDLLGFLG
jgi:hypothetical protein